LLKSISDRVIEQELKLLSGLLEPILLQSEGICLAADNIAQIDLESSFGLLALKHSYTRPKVLRSTSTSHTHIEIIDGRHPVLDKLFTSLEDENSTLRHFTPNSLNLTKQSKPNHHNEPF
jgi:DNA mismatch repair ATPase MutS